MLEGIATGLTVLLIGAAATWLRSPQNRDELRERLREYACRHQWERIPDDGPIGGGGTFWCTKCRARR